MHIETTIAPEPESATDAGTTGITPHHPVFDKFDRTRPYSDNCAHYNFMGARISHDFEIDLAQASPRIDKSIALGLKASGRSSLYDQDERFPHRDSEDYFEWIDLLTAIERAEHSFTMIEVGAGYGRWITNAAAALRRLKTPKTLEKRFIALEANQRRFDFMVRNCGENDLPPSETELRRQACTADGKPVLIRCDDDYGANVMKNDALLNNEAFRHADRIVAQDGAGRKILLEKVQAIDLLQLLNRPIDFLDMDILGAELDVLPPAMEALSNQVKLVHIATHSTLICAKLAHLFHLFGWRPRFIFPTGEMNLTHYGCFRFIDGIQSWENPKFRQSSFSGIR